MNQPVLVVLNMADLARKKDIKINAEKLSIALGCNVVEVSAVERDAEGKIKDAIGSAGKKTEGFRIEYPDEVEDALTKIAGNNRFVKLSSLEVEQKNEGLREKIENTLDDSVDIVIADFRYGYINSVCRSSVRKGENKKRFTEKLDNIVLNRFLGLPLFLAVMYLVFILQ